MDEAAARERLVTDYNVSRETLERLERFAALLAQENERQNLVSRGTLGSLWNRHILDSAQLLRFSPNPDASWIDLGTGPGLPGIIVALLHSGHVTLVEERRRRIEFLEMAVEELGLGTTTRVVGSKVEHMSAEPFDVISARAFAPLDKLLTVGTRFSTEKSRWVLPKGRNAAAELDAVRSSWQGDFRLEQSLTDHDAQIIVAERVRPKGSGKGSGAR
ncbi:MAG TPA: 16S rRNA (guanine(527)-N(7))-methyltransferase RsmG [Allosphingosinicella sp.]|uniref:16S rRNA (guanine(527)-N(7))-methyltransferase RsmG n=1 Tax=Allosphingosinicella sp. TaxID=2823234 RepID=UPI002EDB34E5